MTFSAGDSGVNAHELVTPVHLAQITPGTPGTSSAEQGREVVVPVRSAPRTLRYFDDAGVELLPNPFGQLPAGVRERVRLIELSARMRAPGRVSVHRWLTLSGPTKTPAGSANLVDPADSRRAAR